MNDECGGNACSFPYDSTCRHCRAERERREAPVEQAGGPESSSMDYGGGPFYGIEQAGSPGALDPNESDPYVLWAEIARLQAAVKGPNGYASWQDAATAERVRRVKAEQALWEKRDKASGEQAGSTPDETLREALVAVASQSPILQNSTHGPRWRCRVCGHAWVDGKEQEHHSEHCAYVIARRALATPTNP